MFRGDILSKYRQGKKNKASLSSKYFNVIVHCPNLAKKNKHKFSQEKNSNIFKEKKMQFTSNYCQNYQYTYIQYFFKISKIILFPVKEKWARCSEQEKWC